MRWLAFCVLRSARLRRCAALRRCSLAQLSSRLLQPASAAHKAAGSSAGRSRGRSKRQQQLIQCGTCGGETEEENYCAVRPCMRTCARAPVMQKQRKTRSRLVWGRFLRAECRRYFSLDVPPRLESRFGSFYPQSTRLYFAIRLPLALPGAGAGRRHVPRALIVPR